MTVVAIKAQLERQKEEGKERREEERREDEGVNLAYEKIELLVGALVMQHRGEQMAVARGANA